MPVAPIPVYIFVSGPSCSPSTAEIVLVSVAFVFVIGLIIYMIWDMRKY